MKGDIGYIKNNREIDKNRKIIKIIR